MSEVEFDPERLPRYTVILQPYKFQSGYAEPKRFVVLGHVEGHAFCVKATSQVEVYVQSKERMAGCVFYAAGELPFFEAPTAIQPDNQFAIPHESILRALDHGAFRVIGQMPADFHDKFIHAVKNSVTISPRESKRLLDFLK